MHSLLSLKQWLSIFFLSSIGILAAMAVTAYKEQVIKEKIFAEPLPSLSCR